MISQNSEPFAPANPPFSVQRLLALDEQSSSSSTLASVSGFP